MYLVLARDQWFHADDWYFLADRNGGSLHDLFRPHNEHWSTLPVITFRILWQLVGLRSYLPYLAIVVCLHVAVACLLRVIMRRAGVRAWTATAGAVLFVFFGTGYDDIVFAFQIGFVGALAFGLVHLILADHDGSLSRRDALGLLAGLAGLLCSGVAVTMTVIVGLAAAIRRGPRIALFHVLPLAAVYLVWFVSTARDSYTTNAGFGEVARFIGTDLRATFDALGQLPGLGALLGAALVFGLAVAWRPLRGRELRRRIAAPAALLIGGVVFLAIVAIGRATQPTTVFRQPPAPSRYLYIVAALVLPALAVAVDALGRRLGRAGSIAAVIVLLLGVPGNIGELTRYLDRWLPFVRLERQTILTTARLPITSELPKTYEPFVPFVQKVTIEWLRAGAASGRIPSPGAITPAAESAASLNLVVKQVQTAPSVSNGRCVTINQPVTIPVQQDDLITVGRGRAVNLAYTGSGAASLPPVTYGPADRTLVLEMLTGPVPLRIAPDGPSNVRLCRAGR